MRKKVLIWTLGAIIVLAASVNVGMHLFGNNAERDLFLANVEALTEVEIAIGTCGWGRMIYVGGAYIEESWCGISSQSAQWLVAEYGGNWCCQSCSSTWYCGDWF